MFSANLEKTRTISVCSQRSTHWNCALESHFPSSEERVRPSFPARSKWGLISVSPCPFAPAVQKCHLELTALAAATTLRRHRGHWETLLQTPLLSWHNWAYSFPVNSSRCLRCKLQSAYPPKRCYVCVCTRLTGPIPWKTSKEEELLEENPQWILSHQEPRSTEVPPGKEVRSCSQPQAFLSCLRPCSRPCAFGNILSKGL